MRCSCYSLLLLLHKVHTHRATTLEKYESIKQAFGFFVTKLKCNSAWFMSCHTQENKHYIPPAAQPDTVIKTIEKLFPVQSPGIIFPAIFNVENSGRQARQQPKF